MSRFVDALHSGRVLLMDGAMGTELQRRGLPDGVPPELWNLTHPEHVCAVHSAYRDAGAEILVTNTFQANPAALARHGLRDRLGDIWQAALTHARRPSAFVLADIGPVAELGLHQCAMLLDHCRGADGLLFETWSPVEQLSIFAHANGARNGPNLPLFVSFTYARPDKDDLPYTLNRVRAEECARFAEKLGAIAVGVNCGRELDMDDCRFIVSRYHAGTGLPTLIRPNAGTPHRTAAGWAYPHAPAAMADKLRPILEAGVTIVGGCCGTTPAHIAAFRRVIDPWNSRLRVSG
jgi:5-methyltetrahydrofolate--homocysteine methyltransferase